MAKGAGQLGTFAGQQRNIQNVTNAFATALNANGAKLKVDGVYGKKTAAAVAHFQKSKGMKATGKVDDKTAAALGAM